MSHPSRAPSPPFALPGYQHSMVIAEQGGPASEEASAAAKQRALVEGVAASSAAVVEGRAVSAAADTAAKVVDTAEEAEEDEDEEVEEDAPGGS